jgi:RNA polymerase sigma factor (sigma-70 family)
MMGDPLLGRPASATAEAANADERSQTTLFADTRLGLTRLAFLLTGSRPIAEELVQDAFEQVVRRWDVVERPEGYLRVAVINGARSWSRRRFAPVEAIAHVVEIDQEAVAVRSVLAALPHHQREALVLRYFAGFTDSEIATALDQPLGTVKSNLRRGLARMRKVFE